MPVFGWDASDYDWDRGGMDYAAAYKDGIQFSTHKATEGTNVTHIHLKDGLTRARDAGIPVLGAYHVVRSGAVAAQLDHFIGTLDRAIPWWRNWPNWIMQVDLEIWPYDSVSADTGIQFVRLLRNRIPDKLIALYASKGQYGDSLLGDIPEGVVLWNANYGTNIAGWYRSLYPGDYSARWGSYSGMVPTFLQYGSNMRIGTQSTCDANAFRGSLDDLLALTGGNFMASIAEYITAYMQGVEHTPDGNVVCPVDWRIRDEAWQKSVDTAIAEIKSAIANLAPTVDPVAVAQALIDLLQQDKPAS